MLVASPRNQLSLLFVDDFDGCGCRLPAVSPTHRKGRRIQQPNGVLDGGRTDVHVSLSSGQVPVAGQLLDHPRSRATHRQVRAERVTEDVDTDVAKIGTTSCPRNEALDEALS